MSGLLITDIMSQTEKQDTASLLMIQICCAYMTFKQEAKMVWWGNYFSVNQKSVLEQGQLQSCKPGIIQ